MKYATLLFFPLLFLNCGADSSRRLSDSSGTDEIKTPINLEVFAEQFKWSIRYSGQDNELGKVDYKLISTSNPLGVKTKEKISNRIAELEGELAHMDSMSLTMEVTEEFIENRAKKDKHLRLLKQMADKHVDITDKSASDDFIITDTMVLCVDHEYALNFRSKDVIHAAYFPHFRVRMNVVPGTVTNFRFTPTETTKEYRVKRKDDSLEYVLMCNKICGAGHTSMKMVVRVVDKEEYIEWLKSN